MNKTIKIIIGVIIAVIVIGEIWYGVSRKPAEKGPIKIGFISALTGGAAAYGETEKNVVELALKEINDSGELNRKLEAVYEDGKCDGKEAVTAAQKLINIDKVKIILGGGCSSETLGAAPLAEANKVILFLLFPVILQSASRAIIYFATVLPMRNLERPTQNSYSRRE